MAVQDELLIPHRCCGRKGGMQGTWRVLNLFHQQPESCEVPSGGAEGSPL